ncbi:RNA polymerase sigma factor [Alkalibacillus filiformis]|uniref:RNA polymerase sigma factor SigI n=1 Tax=Alkalibacillus filiformis TaxID=200990 RepID=A0ABU0DUR8_9BACI|nr:sigma factor [Alkalibacillus filiformis]MDQ0352100.1 RNA polymerase sigma factor [Alkalibacillus filiformis]
MDTTQEVEEILHSIKDGDELARERLIKYYKPYILNVAGNVCKRYISWSDEEASISLLAFNKAIDTYKDDQDRTFTSYAYLIIKRDLVDFFKKENQRHHLSLDVEGGDVISREEYSIGFYEGSERKRDLVDEIMDLNEQLTKYGVVFEELEDYSPKHKKTRQSLLEAATFFVQKEELVKELFVKKKLPISKLVKETSYKYKTLEKHRKYLVTIILIKLHPEWVQLQGFLKPSNEKGGS